MALCQVLQGLCTGPIASQKINLSEPDSLKKVQVDGWDAQFVMDRVRTRRNVFFASSPLQKQYE